MKRALSIILSIVLLSTYQVAFADTRYKSVTVTFLPYDDNGEDEFRQWASDVVSEYMNNYDYFTRDFYRAAVLIHQFDIDDGSWLWKNEAITSKDLFSNDKVVRDYHTLPEGGDGLVSHEDWIRIHKPAYLDILAMAVQTRVETDPTFFEDLDNVNIGKVWSYDPTTGNWSYSEALNALNGIDNIKWKNAVEQLASDAAFATINAVTKYKFKITMEDKAGAIEDITKVLSKSIQNAMNELISTYNENRTKEIKNILNNAIREEIANRICKADEKMISLIESIYQNSAYFAYDSVSTWNEMLVMSTSEREELMRAAADELISIYRNNQLKANITSGQILAELQEWDGIEEYYTIGIGRILQVVALQWCKSAIGELLDLCKKEITDLPKDANGNKLPLSAGDEVYYSIMMLLSPCYDLAKDTLNQVFDTQINGIKDGSLDPSSTSIGTILNSYWDAISTDLAERWEKELVKSLSKIVTSATKLDGKEHSFLKYTDDITALIQKVKSGENSSAEWTALIKKIIVNVFKDSASFLESKVDDIKTDLDEHQYNILYEAKWENIKEQYSAQKERFEDIANHLDIIDVKAWADVGVDFAKSVQAAHDDASDNSQASYIATKLYDTWQESNAYRVRTLLIDNPNARFDSVFGPNNIMNPELTSIYGISEVVSSILICYGTYATGLEHYLSLLAGDSSVKKYIVKHANDEGIDYVTNVVGITNKRDELTRLKNRRESEKRKYESFFAY